MDLRDFGKTSEEHHISSTIVFLFPFAIVITTLTGLQIAAGILMWTDFYERLKKERNKKNVGNVCSYLKKNSPKSNLLNDSTLKKYPRATLPLVNQ